MEVTFGPFITCFLAVFFLMVYMVFTIYVRKNVLYNSLGKYQIQSRKKEQLIPKIKLL